MVDTEYCEECYPKAMTLWIVGLSLSVITLVGGFLMGLLWGVIR